TQRIAISLASTWRRRRWLAEVVSGDVPEAEPIRDEAEFVLGQLTVTRWLAALPPRQRAVIMLRFLADLPVEQTAAVLGCLPRNGAWPSQPAGAPSRSSSTAPSPPAWAEKCLPPNAVDRLGPAPAYIGLTWDAAGRLAHARGDHLEFVGAGRRCGYFNLLIPRR